jgi:3-hydroxyisobutyryl-CoA hydrolase
MESSKTHVIVKGAGDKAFSAGGDVKDVTGSPLERCKDVFRHQLLNYNLVANYRKPYIAIMNGITMGGASPFSIAGKYRVATEKTIYAMPETAIGFFNDAGASYFLPRLKFNIGLYMGMTGSKLKGYDVAKVGLASHFVDSSRIEDLEKALLESKNEDEIVAALSKHSSVPSSTETELDQTIQLIDKCFDGETVEEIYENLHLDGSAWAMDTIRTLNKMSPTSLKVTHKSITTGKNMSLHECLKMEFRLAINHCIESDLKEGVRALLIDKDMKPKWNPPSLNEVSDDHVNKFFNALPDGDEVTFESRH